MLINLLVSILKIYQYLVSPLLGNCCRFSPSCSQYAVQSLKAHGFIHGTYYLMLRIFRCHPLCVGGYDPIPERKQKC